MSEREIPICPLLSMALSPNFESCQLEKCAWYMPNKEGCVIRIIARDLSSIAYMIYVKAEK